MSLKSVVNKRSVIILLGFVVGVGVSQLLNETVFTEEQNIKDSASMLADNSQADQPLYWVAPMDANYRRDKPGKSPMGMDLVPVYAEESNSDELGEGAIKINPSVINNLGVRTKLVKRGRLQNQIDTVGFITYNEDRLVHIHPRIAGWVEKLYVKATGDVVEKGQPLYELYSPELVNAQEEYLLTLAAQDKELIVAAESRLKALHIPIDIIEEIRSTKQVKQNVMFTASQSGIVKDLNIREGFYVELGTRLFSIGDLSQVWVEAEVFERQFRQIQQGDKVTMTLDYLPEHFWHGEVDYIHPILDAKTRTVKVRLRFDNPKYLLKPNMFAQVTIHSSNSQQNILIPKEALIRTGKQDRVVLALGEGRFKSIAVVIGNQDYQSFEVLSGLNEDDEIVTSAQFLIDSESSKTSDFLRMSTLNNQSEKVWTLATIHSVMSDHRMVNLSHEAISDWDWPEMTMGLMVGDDVDISLLHKGLSLHIEIHKTLEGNYVISEIHIMDDMSDMEMGSSDNSENSISFARVKGIVNHFNDEDKAVNISRGPIEKWQRPEATMDFSYAEHLLASDFILGQEIDFTFEIHDGVFVITELHLVENLPDDTNTNDHQNH